MTKISSDPESLEDRARAIASAPWAFASSDKTALIEELLVENGKLRAQLEKEKFNDE